MSVLFTIQSAQPVISPPTGFIAINGETIFISGEQFKKNIIKISGQNIYNSSYDFSIDGLNNKNISGINNTLGDNLVGFTISGITPSKYKVYVYNDASVSSNYINLNILDQPIISGFDNKNVLPGEYVKISGYNLNPGANLSFIDNSGNKVNPSFIETGLYRVTGGNIQNYGSGYNIGDTFYLQGFKKYDTNSYAILTVSTTGINGSLGSFDITNSGIFTVPNQTTGVEFIPNIGNGKNGLINFLYEKYENTGSLQFIEFQVPYNIRRNQSGIIENLKFRGINSGTKFDNFYISGYPNIYGFYPTTGLIESTQIVLTGDNLSFFTDLKIGDQSISNYSLIENTGLYFHIPNYSSSDYITVSGKYGSDKTKNILNVFYPPLIASGFSPNDVLAGTGALITISGKYLQRINYINLGQPNVLKKDITINSAADRASFVLPNAYTTTSLQIFSVDFPNSGILIKSPSTNNLLVSTVRLSENNINIRYLSGIQAAKYLDEMEIYSSSGTSGDYGNLTDSEVFFLGITGNVDAPNDYLISGIKISNSATGIRFKVPREVRNPQARIKIKRNRFDESYILPSNKSIDILPTIYDCSSSNTLYNNLGYIRISGINASNANLIYFSGYSGTQNLLGYKEIKNFPLEIVNKNLTQITGTNGIGGNNTGGYTVFEAKLGGDITGKGELFLFNNYYDTGIGYENELITKNKNVKVSAISGFRPPNSDIFTSPGYVSTPLENAFFYQIQTNSRATRFEFSPTTISGVGEGDWPTGLETYLNSANQIFGQPLVGGIYYLKIRALDGERPNEGMILNLAVGYSGRSLSGPGITYRGPWKYGIGYVGSNLRRDVVKYSREGVNHWYAAYTNIDSEPQAGNPNWIPFTNEFAATATQILLAEESNITNALNIGQEGILSGYIKTVNDKNVDEGSGFYLGYDNRYNFNKPKFRVGNEDGYIKFDGQGLDILGPLSGVVTTSKNIKNANNIVEADSSVALGINNKIDKKTDNVFIFGTNNLISGSRRSSIIAGKNNVISTVKSFFSDNSTIGGGENNTLLGSFCNIVGGFGNTIDATSTGLSSIANQMFIKNINNEADIYLIEYPSQLFTDELAILTNIESNNNIYKVDKISDITTIDYVLDVYPNINNDNKIKIYNWISLLSPNLYSGSFIGTGNSVCEFKTERTGLNLGSKTYKINFTQPFVNSNELIIMPNLIGNNGVYKSINISGLNRTGFYIDFPNVLEENVLLDYFVGIKGFFTGAELNDGVHLEINKVYPFQKLITGTGYRYDIPLKRKGINFFNIYDNNINWFPLGAISGNTSDLRLTLSAELKDNNHYININSLGFTGKYSGENIQVYQTGLKSGENLLYINLLSGILDTGYAPLCNIIQSGNSSKNIYSHFISGKSSTGFYFHTSRPIDQDAQVNVSIYRTGEFNIDNTKINVNSLTYTGFLNNELNINFNNYLNYDSPKVFLSIENINNDNIYLQRLKNIYQTGLNIQLSDNIATGDRIKINYIIFSNTGSGLFDVQQNILIDNSASFTGDINIKFIDKFNLSPKIFGRAYSSLDEIYLHNISNTGNDGFSFSLSAPLSVNQMTGLIYEYIASDLEKDLNIAKSVLSTFNYARLGAFGFSDIGSSTIGGGTGNYIKGLVSSIAGGVNNTIIGDFNLIPGGRSNKIIDIFNPNDQYPKSAFCTVLGGSNNLVTGNLQYTNIVGGSGNLIVNNNNIYSDSFSSILGGSLNIVSGTYSNVLGGTNNLISGSYSNALGKNITIKNSGSIVLSDASTGVKNISQENTLFLNFANGIYITGQDPNHSPIVFDLTKLPTTNSFIPKGGVWLSGGVLCVKT